MRFRNASPDDLKDIVEIYNSTISSRMVTADTTPVSVESRVNWFKEHDAGSRPLWVVEEEARTIGWVSFQSFYGRPAYAATAEISIYLHAVARGKGLGKKVLEHSILQSRSLGIKTLLGYIFAHNEPSLRLFRSFGFQDWALLPNIAVLDGVERSLVIVGKRITQ
ncbi:GNAT family N-acetyltransferase [Fulvivirgaceae bacterium PWU4]|uniref:GNAT family N-acetyltransferase n=1 Tax=Chryseosolibacter histidini TaxID=2782349 RepID=A0AAP2DQN0_9BACT|nr:GNAT family N-acetyltransferase [Chryseosolibacter histidini]MBT1699452.1 GNAT family N-acetyltransferase [Chryseosolibacter histidini]